MLEAVSRFPEALSAGAKPLLLSISALQMMEEIAYIFCIFVFPMNSARMENLRDASLLLYIPSKSGTAASIMLAFYRFRARSRVQYFLTPSENKYQQRELLRNVKAHWKGNGTTQSTDFFLALKAKLQIFLYIGKKLSRHPWQCHVCVLRQAVIFSPSLCPRGGLQCQHAVISGLQTGPEAASSECLGLSSRSS